ncbi:MAG: hypothetical protein JNM36_08760 [Chitinophagales bacterium]|jgi:3-phosphoshikimate 1-carboxyvinyltransferase|nr:hypothetical protein [Chitinophagales bacterium]
MQAYHLSKPTPNLVGTIYLDGSKSISNRALVINALCRQPAQLHNCSTSDDTKVLQHALQHLPATIDIGAAGTSMRFLTAYLATQQGQQHTLTGSTRMKQRPIALLVEALQALGAKIDYVDQKGFPPLHIVGQQLKGRQITIDSSMSSQYVSALLLIAPLLEGGLTLQLSGSTVSESYIAMTLSVMADFGVEVEQDGERLVVQQQHYQAPQQYWIESDWSAASYYYSLAAMTLAKGEQCELCLQTLRTTSRQGDSAIQQIGTHFGVQTIAHTTQIMLQATNQHGDNVAYLNCLTCPDIVQTIAVMAAALGKTLQLDGLQTLRIKETDRTAALVTELAKIGVNFVPINENCWQVQPLRPLHEITTTPIFDTYDDHRMAMALAPLSLLLPQGIIIREPSVVSKSYPNFWKDLAILGFQIKTING